MKKIYPLITILFFIAITACTAVVTPNLTSTNTVVVPTQIAATTESPFKEYNNSKFGVTFQFPKDWYGPEEYVDGQTLRVEIGSDVVYPYGTDPAEQSSTRTNTYTIIVQYMHGDNAAAWTDTYQAVEKLADGESVSGTRSKLIRVGEHSFGKFHGIEFISTLSETAATEPTYIREVIFFDDASNVLSVMGTPNRVDIPEGTPWQDIYKQIDSENVTVFDDLINSLAVQ